MVLNSQSRLMGHKVQPSSQRLAVADYVLHTREHPSAERVWEVVSKRLPMISKATVYNTLHLFVEVGLLRVLKLDEDRLLFDPVMEPHHHLVDQDTGEIVDLPLSEVPLTVQPVVHGYEIEHVQLVLRGRKLGGPRTPRQGPKPMRKSKSKS